MVAEIYGSLTAFKAMFDMAKALKDINDATIRNAAIIELLKKKSSEHRSNRRRCWSE